MRGCIVFRENALAVRVEDEEGGDGVKGQVALRRIRLCPLRFYRKSRLTMIRETTAGELSREHSQRTLACRRGRETEDALLFAGVKRGPKQ